MILKSIQVKVICGKYKGKTSTINRYIKNKVLINNVNIATKHIKGSNKTKGKIIQKEMPIDKSNIKIINKCLD